MLEPGGGVAIPPSMSYYKIRLAAKVRYKFTIRLKRSKDDMRLPERGDLEDYAKAALILILQVRFREFLHKFGYEPGLDDPLFFDESEAFPVGADHVTVRRQMIDGAEIAGVEPAPVFTFLGMDRLAEEPEEEGRSWLVSAPKPDEHLECSQHQALNESPVWNKFLSDRRLHRRHGITSEELQFISGASFMGDVTKVEDILFVLNVLRGRGKFS